MIVDAHIHYIEPPSADRPYTGRVAMAPITVEQVIERATGAGVDRIVQVTASTMGNDNRYSFEGAIRHPDRVLGVVGRFDPLAPGLRDRLQAYCAQPAMIGIRLTLFHDWSRDWLKDRALDGFLAEAERQNVPICLHAPEQTALLRDTVRRFPGVKFVVDHMNIRYEAGMTVDSCFAHWSELCALADEPNVWTKVSYFPEASFASESYPYPTGAARFRQLYEAVGASRLIWGSNFPPLERACSYAASLALFRNDYASVMPPEDMAAVLGGNFLRDFAAVSSATAPSTISTTTTTKTTETRR